jgi:hypothetical protein
LGQPLVKKVEGGGGMEGEEEEELTLDLDYITVE